nr:TetR family transcriptional regulator C-terminal domain-containing protein [Streptomyces sp. SID8352]
MAQYELTLWSLRSESSRHLAQRVYRRYIDGCLQLLRECRAPGDEDIDLELLAREIIALLDGHVLQWLALGDDTFERMVDRSTRLLQDQFTPLPAATS